jgi:hypothetical protein
LHVLNFIKLTNFGHVRRLGTVRVVMFFVILKKIRTSVALRNVTEVLNIRLGWNRFSWVGLG